MASTKEKDETSSVSQSNYCCGNNSSTENDLVDEDELSYETKVKQKVRNQYGQIAEMSHRNEKDEQIKVEPKLNNSEYTNYSSEDLKSIPTESNLGLGSGNPVRLANIKSGEVVVDLGSGAGIDCFLASKLVGPSGKIIGVDMTPQMIDRARENAKKNSYQNIEFRLGEIEHLPVEDNSVDVIISNCVINLAVDKKQVFKDAYRVLKPGGRLLVSDIVFGNRLPEKVHNLLQGTESCVSRAWLEEEYLDSIRVAGFKDVKIVESQIISPRNKSVKTESGNTKRKLIVDGSPFEVELTPEEDELTLDAIRKAHIGGVKPF